MPEKSGGCASQMLETLHLVWQVANRAPLNGKAECPQPQVGSFPVTFLRCDLAGGFSATRSRRIGPATIDCGRSVDRGPLSRKLILGMVAAAFIGGDLPVYIPTCQVYFSRVTCQTMSPVHHRSTSPSTRCHVQCDG